ncbi:MAG TPA: copper-binding protein [Caulobacterales bacterium]|nr:copper-binding protein [Caulobacterales bacterium]
MHRSTLALALLAVAACDPQPAATHPSTSSSVADMPMASATAAGPIVGSGAVTAINTAAHVITISHGPISAIGWPAMTMTFTPEHPALLSGISVGDRVSFQLKSEQEPAIIVAISKE